jgi:hypothetical protein
MTPDVQCDARLDSENPESRCQLYIGHEQAHAVLILRSGERTLARWTARTLSDERFGADVSEQLSWAPGFPQAVIESWSVARRGRGSNLHVVVDASASSAADVEPVHTVTAPIAAESAAQRNIA